MPAACAGLFGRVPRLLLIVAAMAAGYSLRSFPNAASPFRHISQAEAVDDAHGFGPALDDATSGRVPGDFEKKEAILLGVNELLEFHPETLVEIVAALGPQFPDFSPELDRQALEIYRRAFPERRVVGIDSSKIIAKRGGLHCLALSIPELPDRQ